MSIIHREVWPERSFAELSRLIAVVWVPSNPALPEELKPHDTITINDQPLVIVRELSLVEYRQRVLEANLPHWLGAPMIGKYYEVTSD